MKPAATVHEANEARKPAGGGDSSQSPFELARLDHLAVVSLTGRDAAAFLHNQVSNDVEHLEINESVLAAYCNPKGRVITFLRVLRTGETDFLLLIPHDLVEPAVKRLRMFVLRQKASFETLESCAVFGLPDAARARALSDDLPRSRRAVPFENGWLVNAGYATDRFLFVATDGAPPARMSADAGDAEWFGVMAADALPQVFGATTEAFLPQALNMDRIDAINFRKGCFPGQEIVARLRYLGKLKQRMVRATFAGAAPPPGSAVMAGGKKIGQLVLAGPAEGTMMGLVSVNFAQLGGDSLSFEDGTPLTVSLPDYEVPELAAAR